MREGRDGGHHQLPSLRDADRPEYPQIPYLRRVRLADYRDVGAFYCFYGDASDLYVYLPGLKIPKVKLIKDSWVPASSSRIFLQMFFDQLNMSPQTIQFISV